MILLDTNILSEMMKTQPAPIVSTWMDKQPKEKLFITTINIAEITYGLQILPDGKRRTALIDAFHKIVDHQFKYRIYRFDKDAAYSYGEIMAYRKKSGKPLSVPDGQIAAIAHCNRATLATRNISDFTDCFIELINPFQQ